MAGQRYIFHLRDDVFWSDGAPVTAHDYAFAWKRVLDPATGSPGASLLYDVAGARAFHVGRGGREGVAIQAADDRTLVLGLEAPTGYVLHLVASASLTPVPRHVVEARGEDWTRSGELVGNGPFRLASRIPGQRMVLERNPRFHGSFGGNVDRVELFHHAAGPSTEGFVLYEGDGLDVLSLDQLRPADRDRARQRRAGEFVTRQMPSMSYLAMHPGLPPFDDLRVRRAFALGTDREQLARMTAGAGLMLPTGGFLPRGMPGHSPGIALPYNPHQAEQLLVEAGYPGGAGFPAVAALGASRSGSLLEALAALWREALGIQVEPEILDWASYPRAPGWGSAPSVRHWLGCRVSRPQHVFACGPDQAHQPVAQ